ncbi:hypothetical protein BDV59DRAFT_169179 [Aspergillus ambiguus]|uniref:SDR family oxidoreductase n=1 Tax=Aspergillus ambiguus TaxID=176160 RepID=UPI003CCCD160
MSRTPPNGKIVLVTGATGFIGSHITAALLESGYLVRATVRSQVASHQIFSSHAKYTDRLSVCTVPNMTLEGAFDNAVREVDSVIHTASPFHFAPGSVEDILDPATKGTTSLLDSIYRCNPGIKRVVITSSFAAMLDLDKGIRPGYIYTETDWHPVDADALSTAEPLKLYLASKTLAEQAAWEFMDQLKPTFDLVTICPPLTYGPIIHCVRDSSNLNTSIVDFYRLMNGSCATVPEGTPISCVFVDVRDVAKIHLLALEAPQAAGQRYLVVNGNYTYQQVVDILRSEVMQVRGQVPVGNPGSTGPQTYQVSNVKSRRELGMTYRTLAETVVDTANSLLQLEETKAGEETTA